MANARASVQPLQAVTGRITPIPIGHALVLPEDEMF